MGSTYALNKSESEGIFKFCGIKDVQHVIFYNVVMADDETRKGYLEKARQLGRDF
jgi:putative NADPH-quinone reductase